MKNYFTAFLCFFTFASCSNDDDQTNVFKTDLIGKWQLIEQLVDPGDGSGTFQPVESEFIIEFFNNGTVTSSNGTLCTMTLEAQEGIGSGTYSLENNTITLQCIKDQITIFFEKSGTNLILNFTCIEPCAQKYRKL